MSAAASNTDTRYGTVAMILHWLIALMIIANLCTGLWFAEFMAHSNPLRFSIIQLHKSFGITILALSVLRLLWRLVNPIPPLPTRMNPVLKIVARGSHFLLYFLIIAIPFAGWLLISASPAGVPTMYFGLFPWPSLPGFAGLPRTDKAHYAHAFATAHSLMAYLLIALLVIHVAAALYHQFIRRDTVLRRMWFGTEVKEIPQ